MLSQISQLQLRMSNNVPFVELFLAQQNPQQRTLARAVAATKTDLGLIGYRGLSAFEQHLVAVAFVGVLNLQQHGHKQITQSVALAPSKVLSMIAALMELRIARCRRT